MACSVEAQLILNKFQVYKILRIQINSIVKKENNVQNRNQNVYFLMLIQVALRLLSAFKGAYPGLLPETNFKSLHTICISNTPTFFDVMYLKIHRNGLTPKMSDFLSNMAAMINLKEKACFGKLTISF